VTEICGFAYYLGYLASLSALIDVGLKIYSLADALPTNVLSRPTYGKSNPHVYR